MSEHKSTHRLVKHKNPDYKPDPDKFTLRQRKFLQFWLDPKSETYDDCYNSALLAGYSESYARCIAHYGREWRDAALKKADELVTVEEITLGIKAETKGKKPTARLKAWELLGKNKKMFVDKYEVDANMPSKFIIEEEIDEPDSDINEEKETATEDNPS